MPWLLVSSPDDPASRYLYKIAKVEKYEKNIVEPQCERKLPEIAGHCIFGSSHGLLFTTPPVTQRRGSKIRAINPLAGEGDEPLCLPPCDAILPGEKSWEKEFDPLSRGAKAVISPSRDTVVIHVPVRGVHFARLDTPSSSWTRLPLRFHIDDFIFHKGRLYFVTSRGNLAVSGGDNDFSSVSHVCSSDIDVESLEDQDRVTHMHLAESPDGDDLFLLMREWAFYAHQSRTAAFQVFKLSGDRDDGSSGRRRWKEVYNLGDVAVFLGLNRAVSFCASDFPVLKSNAIYFTDNVIKGGRSYDWPDAGVFCLEDESFDFFDVANGSTPIWLENVAAW